MLCLPPILRLHLPCHPDTDAAVAGLANIPNTCRASTRLDSLILNQAPNQLSCIRAHLLMLMIYIPSWVAVSFSPQSMPHELGGEALRIGPLSLKRLLFLHLTHGSRLFARSSYGPRNRIPRQMIATSATRSSCGRDRLLLRTLRGMLGQVGSLVFSLGHSARITLT